jgi:hypothetical protein
MKSIVIAAMISLMAVCAQAQQVRTTSPTDQFWAELKKLCGKAFEGVIAEDTANNPDFAGKRLVMHVRSC